MRKSKFSEEQIIAILAEQERGMATSEVCRRHGVSSATFYKWKAKFGGMDVSDARRLKTLETENARLKKLLLTLPYGTRHFACVTLPHRPDARTGGHHHEP
jgi:putative transposase